MLKVRLSQNEFMKSSIFQKMPRKIWRICALCTVKTLRAEILQIFWDIFGSSENLKFAFEINWPLEKVHVNSRRFHKCHRTLKKNSVFCKKFTRELWQRRNFQSKKQLRWSEWICIKSGVLEDILFSSEWIERKKWLKLLTRLNAAKSRI